MEKNTLRIRLVSFKDTAKQNLNNLFYIKKLTQLPSSNGKILIQIIEFYMKFQMFRFDNDTRTIRSRSSICSFG
jgi:hypothetical protein